MGIETIKQESESPPSASCIRVNLSILFPQRYMGWFWLMSVKLLKFGLRHAITCKFEQLLFNIFLLGIHLGFVSRHPFKSHCLISENSLLQYHFPFFLEAFSFSLKSSSEPIWPSDSEPPGPAFPVGLCGVHGCSSSRAFVASLLFAGRCRNTKLKIIIMT